MFYGGSNTNKVKYKTAFATIQNIRQSVNVYTQKFGSHKGFNNLRVCTLLRILNHV